MKPRLLDLFCGAGGCSMGYHRAGFDVVGVDIKRQKRYPFEFVQADAIEYILAHGHEYDIIHASPPCQFYSVTAPLSNGNHPDLVGPTRVALLEVGKPYVIENVVGAPLINPLMLCGTMFGLRVQRHRLFEIWPNPIWFPPHPCKHDGLATGNHLRRSGDTRTPGFKDGYNFITVAGNNYLVADGQLAMDIDWTTKAELSQAIPPAYTEWIGKQLMEQFDA